MQIHTRLKQLRQSLGLSQEAIGAQGFVSTPGWIKIENGQREPSEKLLEKLVVWLVADKYMRPGSAKSLKEELLTLKYLGVKSPFVRAMAMAHAKTLPNAAQLLAPQPKAPKPRRGRPAMKAASPAATARPSKKATAALAGQSYGGTSPQQQPT